MARGINKVILVGHLGKDPEVRYLQNSKVANLSVATSETWRDNNGATQSRTEWHNVTVFAHHAEFAGAYLKKGSKVYVEGRLQTDKYQKDGQDRYITKVIGHELQGLDSAGNQSGQQQAPAPTQPGGYSGSFDDDIPYQQSGQ